MRLFIANPAIAGTAIYIPKLSTITEIPNPKTCDSLPSTANVIIDKLEIIRVSVSFTTTLIIGLSRSKSAIMGENEY